MSGFSKQKFAFVFLLYFIQISNFAYSQIQFEKVFGGTGNDRAQEIQRTFDNGFIVAGFINDSSFFRDGYLLKSDSLGNTLWGKKYGGSNDDYFLGLVQTKDSGYIAVGASESFGSDIYVVKTDINGDTLWTRTYGGLYNQSAINIIQTLDGGYFITGNSSGTSLQMYCIKINDLGDLDWSLLLGIDGDRGYCALQTPDSGYLVCGQTESFAMGLWSDYLLIRLNSDGSIRWSKTYNEVGGGTKLPYKMINTKDHGYAIIGLGSFAELVKIDSSGNVIWSMGYLTNFGSEGFDLKETYDGGYILTGSAYDSLTGIQNVYLAKTDSIGNLLWSRKYGGSAEDVGLSVVQCSDSGYFIAGYSLSFGSGQSELYLIKTDPEGVTSCNDSAIYSNSSLRNLINSSPMISAVPFGTMGYTQTIVQNYDSHVDLCSTYTSIPLDFQLEHRIEVYPIPFSDNLNISGIHPIGSLRIYNILGKIVLESKTKTESMNFNTQMLKSGIYILNYTNGAVQSQLKLIKN